MDRACLKWFKVIIDENLLRTVPSLTEHFLRTLEVMDKVSLSGFNPLAPTLAKTGRATHMF